MSDSLDALSDPLRLEAVGALLDAGGADNREFDRLTRLAAKLLNVPTCIISLVTADRQEFKGACGLPGDLATERAAPLSHSICKLTVATGKLVSVANAAEDDRTAGNPAVHALGVQAYLGFPLMASSGQILGSFSMIDYVPRRWTPDEINAGRDFAALAVGQLEASSNNARIRAALDVALHDLKTPLSGILMASSMVKEQIGRIPSQLHPLLEVVESSTAAAIKLVKTLAEEDRRSTVPSCHDPAATLSDVVRRLKPSADSKSIRLHLDIGDTLPLVVSSWALEQILENLLSNSIKYGPESGRIWIGFDISGDSGRFSIRDEGPGFTPGDRERMFQRYARLSAEPTDNESSTGLGLSIVKQLVLQHGGSVELISPAGESAEFRISFRLAATA